MRGQTDPTPPIRSRTPRARRGFAMEYTSVAMLALLGICSLAVDLGHVQMVKTEMQRCADATARGYMNYYNLNGQNTSAQSAAATNWAGLYTSAENPIDGNSGVTPTVSVTWGSWNALANTFSSSAGTTVAVQVKVSRTKANHNAVPLIWGALIGNPSCDLTYTTTAALMGSQSVGVTISSTACPYLAGMPNSASTAAGDNYSNAAPYQLPSIPVIPGTMLTMTSFTGTSTVSPGGVSYTGPNGNTSYLVHHGESWDNNPNAAYSENGIADAVMPENALMGVFLGPNAPNTITAPATIDWTQASMQNKTTYTNLQIQQPFYVGDGQTTGGTIQQFMVPNGATRLFLGVWDGYQYNNNDGTLTGTVTLQNYVEIVQ